MYFSRDRVFSVVDVAHIDPEEGTRARLSHNFPLTILPLTNVSAFLANIGARWVEGTTLWIDFPNPNKWNHMGHWMEILTPIFSHLTTGNKTSQQQKGITTVVFPNIRSRDIETSPWIMQVLILTLANSPETSITVSRNDSEPRFLFLEDLQYANQTKWLCFQQVLHVYSRHDHPNGSREVGFTSPHVAAAFRKKALSFANLPAPSSSTTPPRTITYLMSADSDSILNNGDVLKTLHSVAAQSGFIVRPYSPSSLVPLHSFVSVMSRSGILVTRHGHLLANAVFLPRGSVIVELLPCNWEVDGVSDAFFHLIRTVGVVSHLAWRAPSTDFMSYALPEDKRYSTWTPEECSSETCLDAHARAALRVDTNALGDLVKTAATILKLEEAPDAVQRQHPWPRGIELDGSTGLWWDTD